MDVNKRRYHLSVLSLHNSLMYEDLLYEENISSDTEKEIEFTGYDVIRGYFAKKNKTKYFIETEICQQLPIKIDNETIQELRYKEDIVLRPLNIIPFRIKPEQIFPDTKQFITEFCPFNHTNQTHWLLLKFLALSAYISRTYCCISSNPEFGKSSCFDTIHAITDKCPVFKPRSVPGVLNKINGTGTMVFDDTLEAKKDVREIMEEFSLKIAGGSAVYINGAMKANKTKARYNCHNQSITYLYNNTDCYKNPEKRYFETMFENNKAMDTRFLKVKLGGKLEERFGKDFNMKKVATENRMYYIQLAKHLRWLQDCKQQNLYTRKYQDTGNMALFKGRRRQIYSDITWLIDMYSQDQEEYMTLVNELSKCIIDYRYMVNELKDDSVSKWVDKR